MKTVDEFCSEKCGGALEDREKWVVKLVRAYAEQVRDECARIADSHECKRRDEYYPCCDDLAEKIRKLEI